ncbi:MAG: hypothetical protein ABI330_02010 [Caldimonas sp.]
MPSPVLKLAWHRRQTYIFELDIMGLTPGSPAGLAATYSACVWRSFSAALAAFADGAGVDAGGVVFGALDAEAEERVAMAILVVTAPVPGQGAIREGALLSQ